MEAETVLFADDTNILIQAEDGNVLEQKIIVQWKFLTIGLIQMVGDKYWNINSIISSHMAEQDCIKTSNYV